MQTEERLVSSNQYPAEGDLFSGAWFAALGDGATLRVRGVLHSVFQAGGDHAVFNVYGGEALPSISSDGSRCAVFAGVLYNHRELASELGLSPAASSSELVLSAYSFWGGKFVGHLKGVFALCLWDGVTLICARDPLGAFPLFYAEMGGTLLIASSVKVLHEYAGLPLKPNRAALADHLLHRWPSKEETFYENIFRLTAGHTLRVVGGSRSIERYWTPFRADSTVDWISSQELDQFDTYLDNAANRFLDMGRTGILLSGGLDSVSVAAVLAQNSKIRQADVPIALSLLFPVPECNEEDIQRGVAQQLGMPLVALPFEEGIAPQGLLLGAMTLSRQLSAPLLNAWMPAYYKLLSAGAQQGARIILTGEGGDEWLTITPYLLADMIRGLDVSGIEWYLRYSMNSFKTVKLAKLFWSFGVFPILMQTKHQIEFGMLRRPQPTFATAIPEWIANDNELRGELRARLGRERLPKHIKSFYLHELEPTLDHPLGSWEREESFEIGSQLGVRIFHPYWDAELVDLLYRTPPKLLAMQGKSKGLVRTSLARRFPNLGFERQKKVTSFNFFAHNILTQASRGWEAIGSLEALSDLGIIDPKAVTERLHEIERTQDQGRAYQIWDMFNVESWLRTHM